MTHYIGIDIGGSAIKYALIDQDGNITHANKLKTPSSLDDFINCIQRIQETFWDMPTVGIAISMPGLIDSQTGHAIHGGALSYIRDINIKELLQKACHVTIHVENDGKSAALGEHWLGNLVGVQNGVALVIGTGIAGGIIINNQLVRGHHLTAGEFSYIRTASDPKADSDFFAIEGSAILLSNTYAKIKNIPKEEMTGKLFFADIDAQVPEAVDLLADYSRKMVTQLLNLQTILDPEVITIGGGISRQTALFKQLNQDLDEIVKNFPLPLIRPTIKQSSLGNHANLLGAVKNFINQEELTLTTKK